MTLNRKVKILFLGHSHPHSTAAHRADALKRIGHTVEAYDPYHMVADSIESRVRGIFHYRTGYRLLQARMLRWLKTLKTEVSKAGLIWIDSGELFGIECLQFLKQFQIPIVLYTSDDPGGARDGRRFDSLLEALPLFDVIVVVREETEEEFRSRGVKKVVRVLMSYDERAHAPVSQKTQIPVALRSEVAFLGTWMRHENRAEFLLELIELGIPVSIWGDSWQKSGHFSELRSHWRGPGLGGRNYIDAIRGSKICLGLLSKGNRDLHTQRSLEIPYAGGLLCAERTATHLKMFRDGTDAVFWSGANECAELCRHLLNNDTCREEIRLAGMRRVRELRVGNEDMCETVLQSVFEY